MESSEKNKKLIQDFSFILKKINLDVSTSSNWYKKDITGSLPTYLRVQHTVLKLIFMSLCKEVPSEDDALMRSLQKVKSGNWPEHPECPSPSCNLCSISWLPLAIQPGLSFHSISLVACHLPPSKPRTLCSPIFLVKFSFLQIKIRWIQYCFRRVFRTFGVWLAGHSVLVTCILTSKIFYHSCQGQNTII
jgi:hypothetical protein